MLKPEKQHDYISLNVLYLCNWCRTAGNTSLHFTVSCFLGEYSLKICAFMFWIWVPGHFKRQFPLNIKWLKVIPSHFKQRCVTQKYEAIWIWVCVCECFWRDRKCASPSCYSKRLTPPKPPNSTISPLINKDKWSVAIRRCLFLPSCGAKWQTTDS